MAYPLPKTPEERRALLSALFVNPLEIPATFWSYSNDYNALNQPPVPASNIMGISSFLERLDTNTGTVTISNSAAETTIYSYDVPAGLLQTKGGITVEVSSKWLQNGGANSTLRLRIKYGATTMVSLVTASITASTQTLAVPLRFSLFNKDATNAQEVIGTMSFFQSGATAGYGGLGGVGAGAFGGSAAEDSTAKKTLTVTVELSLANSNNTFTKLFGTCHRASH